MTVVSASTPDAYQRILDALPDVILIMGGDGRIAYANRRVTDVLGYQPEELVGQAHDLLVPDRLREEHARHVESYFRAPKPRPMGVALHLRAKRKDGSEFPAEVSLNPLSDGPRPPILVTLRDVSERARLEEAKDTLASHLANAVSMFPDAFALFDANDRLLLCNEAFRLRFRDIAAPIEGKTYSELIDAVLDQTGVLARGERERLKEKRLAMRGKSIGPGAKLESPDGRCYRLFERPTADGGALLTVTDLTDDERVAAELRNAHAAAEAASRAKSEFLSSMSHELRTPLNAILGFAELLRRDKRDALSTQGKQWVDQIIRAGAHLANLVDDVLDLSRIEEGRVSVAVEPTSVLDVISSVKDGLDPIAETKHVRIVQGAIPNETETVLADRTRLLQIVTNLASNAVKYNRPGGTVAISASLVAPSRVRISVIDTGLGIPSEKQKLLFQPFQRAGQETGPIEGTGIGLVIAKRLAEMMGGAVGFVSTPGEGSHFWVEVPASRIAPSTPSPPEPYSVPAILEDASRVVLYIEDNAANASFMAALFESIANTKLLVAPNAEEGLICVKEHCPDIILMDINLPGMSGIEAFRILRQQSETESIPVIALTAAASEQAKVAAEREGFAAYLTKPVQVETLLRAIERALAGADARVRSTT